MSDAWPWLVLAGLGAFHGLNPAMGWLFAVALGLQRESRAAVLTALAPIALGHLVSIAAVAALLVALGVLVPMDLLKRLGGAALIGWAAYHAVYGHRARVRVGMRAGFAGLFAWSFMMATAHGAGLMLLPALMDICFGAPGAATGSTAAGIGAVQGVLVHAGAMLAVTGLIALLVYEWVGVAVLRSAWINFDYLWIGALTLTGLALILPLGV